MVLGPVACGRTTLVGGTGTGTDTGGMTEEGGTSGEGGVTGQGGNFVKGGRGGTGPVGGKAGAGAVGGSAVGGKGGAIGTGGNIGNGGAPLGGTTGTGGTGGSPVSRLLVEPGFASITLGQSTQFRATVQQAGATRDVTNQADWSVSQTNVATTTANRPGRITGVGAGKTQVKVSFMGLAAVVDVSVVADTLISLSLQPSASTLTIGGIVQFTALGFFKSGNQRDLSADVAWTISDPAVARVGHLGVAGLVLAVAPGTAKVAASINGVSGGALVTVQQETRLNLILEPSDASRRPGESFSFRATGIFTDGSQRNVTGNSVWISANPTVATVDKGLARCVGTGEATIIAIFDGASVEGKLSCRDVTITLLRLTPVETELPRGTRLQYTATAFFSDGTSRIVTDSTRFSSKNPQVAEVTSRGQATAMASGATIIEAVFEGVTGQATITVQ
jgi:trimeric autotransporter adhesin